MQRQTSFQNTRNPRVGALLISLVYAVLGCTYIVISDHLVMADAKMDNQARYALQLIKGFSFVIISGIGLYFVMAYYFKRVNRLVQQGLESETALISALEHYPGPAVIFNSRQHLEYLNLYARHLFGGIEDPHSRTARDLADYLKLTQYFSYLEKTYSTGEPSGGEISIPQELSSRYFVVTFVPIKNDLGGVDRVVGLATDITERKYSAIRMDQQRRELRQIIDLLPSFVFAKDQDGRFIMANESFSQFHGLTAEQMLGKRTEDILYEGDPLDEIIMQDEEVIGKNAIVYRDCQRLRDFHGEEHIFQVTKIPFTTTISNESAVLGMAQDITERLRHEWALNKSQERFRALVDHSLDALFVYNDSGQLTLVNEQACNLLGKTRYELIGQRFDESLGHRPDVESNQLPLFDTGSIIQMQLTASDGRRIPVEIRIGPLPGEDEGSYLAEVRDISDRVQLERERQVFSRLGVDLSASRDASEIAHSLFDSLRKTVMFDCFTFAVRVGSRARYRYKLIVDRVDGELQYFPNFDYELQAGSPAHQLFQGKSRLILRNADHDEAAMSHQMLGEKNRSSRSLVFVPITVAGKVIAIVSVQSYTENAFNEETLQFVQRIADTAAPALESARANRQKSIFVELGRQLGAARTGEDVAELIAQVADELVSWDSCIIGLYDKAADNITYIYIADEVDGKRQRIIEPHPIRRPRLLAERVLKEGPFLLLRETPDPSGSGAFELQNSHKPSLSMLWVPIPGDDGPTGFISLQSNIVNAYDDDDLETAGALADHCGAALNRTAFQEMMRYREERYRLAIESTGAVAYQLDYIQQEYVFMGREIVTITGYQPEDFTPLLWEQITLEFNSDPACNITYDSEGHKHFKQWKTEMRIRHKNGEERWISDQAVQLQNSNGVPIGSLGILRDITEQKRVELALRASEERYALSARGANDGLWDWDLEAGTIHFSERWFQMLGLPVDSNLCRHEQWDALIHPDDLQNFRHQLDQHLRSVTPHLECETRMLHRNGTYRWILVRGIAVRDISGKPTRLAGSQTDVTDRILTQERLLHDAMHDPLTALPNRAMLMEHLAHCLDHMKRGTGYKFALVFMDLDRFKMINDSLGHLIGDHVLVMVAERLRIAVRPLDVVARFAGDEFAVVLEHLNNEHEVPEIVTRIQSVLAQTMNIENHEIMTTISAGVAFGSLAYANASDMLRDADNALYKAKSDGPGRYRIFDASMHQHAVEQLRLEGDLRRAIERGQLRLELQPIINLQSGRVERFESLVRWEHDELGRLMPDRFMQMAEETGLVFDLDEWMLEETCRWYRRWMESRVLDCADHNLVYFNINLSPRHFLRRINLAEKFKEIASRYNVPPCIIGIEITENALLSFHEETRVAMEELKAAGFALYLDDFGKGYSSLSYLHNFPFDVVKIDRQFMMRIQQEVPEREIVNAILTLAGRLKLGVVAEGVESAEQLAMVRKLGCQWAQGFFISPSLPPDAAAEFFKATRG